jgi:hypothetical protein
MNRHFHIWGAIKTFFQKLLSSNEKEKIGCNGGFCTVLGADCNLSFVKLCECISKFEPGCWKSNATESFDSIQRNKQTNSSAKTALKATAEMQPSADSNNTNNALSFRHTASSTLQLVVASVNDKFLNGSTQPLANNFWQCHSFVKNLNKCQMEVNKTETNNFWQCQSFVNVLIDSWQHKSQMEINKTQTNNSWQCRSFVDVLIDSWQQKCQMEIDKTETNNFRQCRLFINMLIDSWQHTC